MMRIPTIPDTLLVLLPAIMVLCSGCDSEPATVHEHAVPAPSAAALDVAELRVQVDAFCGNCHRPPRPRSFPKKAWRMEAERGFDFYYESFRDDLTRPPKEATIAYFESLAPDELQVQVEPAPRPSPVEFSQSSTGAPQFAPPAVSYLAWQSLRSDEAPRLIFTDMRSGQLRAAAVGQDHSASRLLAACAHPAHIEPCDLDQDGERDFVVAELGSAYSGDHSRGAVIWLRPDGEGWTPRLLLSGIGRVADVRCGDFDDDGDSDLIVAEFGHVRTGSIFWLENTALVDGIPQFRKHLIDSRHGTIHVPTADLNGDGRLDFMALISQEYEVVEAFLNQGDGTFRREPVFSADDPAYGSSGIQLVDLDADGDLDVLYSNGDTFGSEYLKPYHGIHWLENRGSYPFENHLLARMVGVQKALAGDLDLDGDLDIVAVALMPKNLLAHPDVEAHGSVIWLEQMPDGTFDRHVLERGRFYHAALELDDFDGDGDLDLAIGNMYPEDDAIQPWTTVWWNEQQP